ncbi:unnamed protein product, partial [Mesorhabditis belari]|uniref:Uncharacterized protein n=1 Tax=Mesorhabditis belari TaxID=2138241 RepID=A0AAF3FGH7_9BILA
MSSEQLSFNSIFLFFASLLTFCILFTNSAAQSLSQCARIHACGATLTSFPQLVPPTEGSGWGSGESPPLYDELLSPLTHFDYGADSETKEFELCSCANNETCDFADESKKLRFDSMLTLHFCEEPTKQIPNECKGRRGIVRVIGSAHGTGQTLASVTQTLVFCSCPVGFKKVSTNMWDHQELSLNYKCF